MSLRTVAAAIAGLVLGAVSMLAFQSTPAPTQSLPPAVREPIPSPAEQVLLAWTSRRLPEAVVERARTLPAVRRMSVVHAGDVRLVASFDADGRTVDRPPAGFAIPLDAIAVDETFATFHRGGVREIMQRLRPDEAVLGSTSARLRRIGPGGAVELEGGGRFTIAGVVDDASVGGAEIAFPAGAIEVPPRYVLVAYGGERDRLELAIRDAAGLAVRFRAPGETTFLRQGDAVLPQALVKARFGEFASRDLPGRGIEQDQAWTRDNIATVAVPVLGRVTCHRAILPALTGALRELQQRNLSFLAGRETFAGCWNPREIAPGEGLSRHAWGVALDLNFVKNPTGVSSAQDARLVDVMERWGFTWGGRWLVPDAAHFEYLRPPRR